MCSATKPEAFLGQVSCCGSERPIGVTRESFALRYIPRDLIALFRHTDLHTSDGTRPTGAIEQVTVGLSLLFVPLARALFDVLTRT